MGFADHQYLAEKIQVLEKERDEWKAKAVALAAQLHSLPQAPEFTQPVCKGCFALGTACGHCQRCDWERLQHGCPVIP